MMELVPPFEEEEDQPSLSVMWGHSEKLVFYKPGNYTTPELDHTGTLISDFYHPETNNNNKSLELFSDSP